MLKVKVGQPITFVYTARGNNPGQKVMLDVVGKPAGAIFENTFNDAIGTTFGNFTWNPSPLSVAPNLRSL